MEKEIAYIEKVKEWLAINGTDFLIDVVVVLLILIICSFIIKAICKSLSMSLRKTGRVSEFLESFINIMDCLSGVWFLYCQSVLLLVFVLTIQLRRQEQELPVQVVLQVFQFVCVFS